MAYYKLALQVAAGEAYQNEIIDTEMEEMEIGADGSFASREEWIEDRIAQWLEDAEKLHKEGFI